MSRGILFPRADMNPISPETETEVILGGQSLIPAHKRIKKLLSTALKGGNLNFGVLCTMNKSLLKQICLHQAMKGRLVNNADRQSDQGYSTEWCLSERQGFPGIA
eukprot:1155412-Pelagomonas_calceolata.AAC.5